MISIAGSLLAGSLLTPNHVLYMAFRGSLGQMAYAVPCSAWLMGNVTVGAA